MNRQIQVVFARNYVPNLSGAEEFVMPKVETKIPTHLFTVPANVYQLLIRGSGGGAAGEFANLEAKTGGNGGAAGQFVSRIVAVCPGQKLEIYIGKGGRYDEGKSRQEISNLQLQNKVFQKSEAEDTIVVDAKEGKTIFVAKGGLGFSGGKSHPMQQNAENGIAAYHNAGTGFCNAAGKWIGYGGGGGGGKHGGTGGCVFSNCKSTRASDAEPNTGSGGGGSALLLQNQQANHFLPGGGADGYLHILYEN